MNEFACTICKKTQEATGDWRDSQITIGTKEDGTWNQVHLGCLVDRYKTYQLSGQLAYENLKSGLQILTPERYHDIWSTLEQPYEIFTLAFTNLKGVFGGQ